MAIYLGIDGGGSKTACAVGNEHTVLAQATAGGSNPVRVEKRQAQHALKTVVQEACERAGVAAASVTRTCVGMAGISAPATRDLVLETIRGSVAGEVLIVGDMEVAMEAAFGAAAGVVVIAGTGSIAFGRDENGQIARAGGWGPTCSDEGSAYWIGRRAVAAVMRAHDRGVATRLSEAVFAEWHINSHDELVARANTVPSPNFACLFPGILAAANAGDELAREALLAAARELATLAATVADRLRPCRADCVRVALAGGVFRHSQAVRLSFYSALRELRPHIALRWSVVEPVLGALALARNGLRDARDLREQNSLE